MPPTVHLHAAVLDAAALTLPSLANMEGPAVREYLSSLATVARKWINAGAPRQQLGLKSTLAPFFLAANARTGQSMYDDIVGTVGNMAVEAVDSEVAFVATIGDSGGGPDIISGGGVDDAVQLVAQQRVDVAPVDSVTSAMRTRLNAPHHSMMETARTLWASVHRGGEEGADFVVGDVVMTASQRGSSLEPTPMLWEGPAVVVDCVGSFQFVVKDSGSSMEKELHATHIKRYVEKDLHIAQALHNMAARGGQDSEVEDLVDHRLDAEGVWKPKLDKVVLTLVDRCLARVVDLTARVAMLVAQRPEAPAARSGSGARHSCGGRGDR